jgi:hypothetical protein
MTPEQKARQQIDPAKYEDTRHSGFGKVQSPLVQFSKEICLLSFRHRPSRRRQPISRRMREPIYSPPRLYWSACAAAGANCMTLSRCSECGNVLENGRCHRCEANSFTRQRCWRTGDRGGKRPERRHTKWTLQDVIDGTWKNAKHHITIYIDTDEGSYRTVHGNYQDSTHVYRFQNDEEGFIHFHKDFLLIQAFVSDMGFLVMQTADRRMSFAYEFDEALFLTCPICYGKSPIEYPGCKFCDWEFEPFQTSA